MPGRAPRRGTDKQRLSATQSRLARTHLKKLYDTALGMGQWDAARKAELVAQVNVQFAQHGEAAVYSTRKLEDWVSNAQYRINVKKRASRGDGPKSWTLNSRTKARHKARRKRGDFFKVQREEVVVGLALCSSGSESDSSCSAAPPAPPAPPAVAHEYSMGPAYTSLRLEFEQKYAAVKAEAVDDDDRPVDHRSCLSPRALSPISRLRHQFERAAIAAESASPGPWAWSATPASEAAVDGTFKQVQAQWESAGFGASEQSSHRGQAFLDSTRFQTGESALDLLQHGEQNFHDWGDWEGTESTLLPTFLTMDEFRPEHPLHGSPSPRAELCSMVEDELPSELEVLGMEAGYEELELEQDDWESMLKSDMHLLPPSLELLDAAPRKPVFGGVPDSSTWNTAKAAVWSGGRAVQVQVQVQAYRCGGAGAMQEQGPSEQVLHADYSFLEPTWGARAHAMETRPLAGVLC